MKSFFCFTFSVLLPLLFLSIGLLTPLTAQTVTIGSGTAITGELPITAYFNYSYSQQIYTRAQIATSGYIFNIRFYFSGGAYGNSSAWKIWIGHTAKTSFTSATDWVPVGSMTQVFDGTVTIPEAGGWMDIALSTPFVYNNTDNLVIAVDENAPLCASNNGNWRSFTSGANTGMFFYSDPTNPDPVSPPASNGRTNNVNQIQLVFAEPQLFLSATTEQGTSANSLVGSANQEVARLKVVTTGTGKPISINSVTFNTSGTTAVADITSAVCYYSNTPAFSTAEFFGSPVVSPNGNIVFTGTKALAAGDNYFWLAYQVSQFATPNNVLDATCTQFVTSEGIGSRVPAVTNPAGSRTITAPQYVTIGSGTAITGELPITTYFNYSYSQQIYTRAQIATSGTISNVRFYFSGGAYGNSSAWKIWIGHTAKTSFTSATDWVPVGSMTQVFDGTVTIPESGGWMDIALSTPFVYNNTDNLVIAVDENAPQCASNNGNWRSFTSGANTGMFFYHDDTNPDPVSPPASNGRTNNINQIQFAFVPPQTFSSATTEQASVAHSAVGSANQEIVRLRVVVFNTTNPISISSVTFNTSGTTAVVDITSAVCYYTSEDGFSTGESFGAPVMSPNGSIVFTGSKALAAGDNYFWLAYNVSNSAAHNGVLDATCTQFITSESESVRTPSITDPTGSRTIKQYNYGGDGTANGGYYFANNTADGGGLASKPVYSWIDPISQNHTHVAALTYWSFDDGNFTIPDLGFNFNFFGNTYRTANVHISTNGFIKFGTVSDLIPGWDASAFPNTSEPNDIIAAVWQDLDMTPARYPEAKIYYGGDAEKMVITWYKAYAFVESGTAATNPNFITFQVILFQDGAIKLQYNDALTSSPLGSLISSDADVGIENSTGTEGIAYRLNGVGGPIISSPVAVQFSRNQNALPIQLSSYTCTLAGRDVVLSWETATEENANKFVIERKLTSGADWVSVAEVPAHGNSNSPKKYNHSDRKLNSGIYIYRLKMIDNDGTFEYSDEVEVDISLPEAFAISQNYPNPFNPSTKFDYQLSTDARVVMELYDITGAKLQTLIDAQQRAGYYTFNFAAPSHLSTGVYIVRMVATGTVGEKPFTSLKKISLIK